MVKSPGTNGSTVYGSANETLQQFRRRVLSEGRKKDVDAAMERMRADNIDPAERNRLIVDAFPPIEPIEEIVPKSTIKKDRPKKEGGSKGTYNTIRAGILNENRREFRVRMEKRGREAWRAAYQFRDLMRDEGYEPVDATRLMIEQFPPTENEIRIANGETDLEPANIQFPVSEKKGDKQSGDDITSEQMQEILEIIPKDAKATRDTEVDWVNAHQKLVTYESLKLDAESGSIPSRGALNQLWTWFLCPGAKPDAWLRMYESGRAKEVEAEQRRLKDDGSKALDRIEEALLNPTEIDEGD